MVPEQVFIVQDSAETFRANAEQVQKQVTIMTELLLAGVDIVDALTFALRLRIGPLFHHEHSVITEGRA